MCRVHTCTALLRTSYLRAAATGHQLLDAGPKAAHRVAAVVVAVHGRQLAVRLDLRH